MVISARDLAASYGGLPVWSGANFQVKKGQITVVLGPNGAGKTTLFRMILGLLPPASGQLKVFGTKPKRGNPRIGYVPQRHLVESDTRLEAVELVKLGLDGNKWGLGSYSKADYQRALDALAEVDAADLAHRSLGQLSGGELQRVFLAQALISQPEILLLDEPLANLDIRRQGTLVNLIAGVAKSKKMAVLLIAHDVNPLLQVIQQVVYIAGGQVATGKPNQVINSETLSRLYGAPVEVLRGSDGRLAVLGAEEAVHHE